MSRPRAEMAAIEQALAAGHPLEYGIVLGYLDWYTAWSRQEEAAP